MKILITGSNGLLGQKLVYKLRNTTGVECIATARGVNRLVQQEGYIYDSLDITNKKNVEDVFSKYLPDVIINTAAMTNVDACETEKETSWLMNATAVEFQVKTLEALQKKNPNYKPHFIHLSTDFIFDGTHGPLDEEEKPNPLSYYAEGKLEAEKIVKASTLHWAIARTVLVYGIVDNMSRSNIVLWVKSNLEQGKVINVVDDQFRTPTLAEDLADGCILIAQKRAKGVYNISGKNFYSILELATVVADYYGLDKSLIKPSKSADIKQPAKRPPITGFIIDKAVNNLGYNPHSFTEGIKLLEDQIKAMGKA
ncbi:SDR family oxidoreductase [Aurantibacillus circumpalustris]|uniref:SDR family oxidoreductase n=1 Tax=Aurantibacillus circumpalustris TaxID=3036359 RepID=UPI00295BEB25|nr:SDR family oxidoreductase [Aurantibacillus circumpalustris]